MRVRPWIPCLVVALLLAGGGGPAAQGQDEEVLQSGRAVEGTLPLGDDTWATYVVDVPEDATRLDVVLESEKDVDLYLKFGGPIVDRWVEEATALANGTSGHEEIHLEPGGTPPLRPGRWWVDVVFPGGSEAARASFRLTATVVGGLAPAVEPPAPPVVAEDVVATFDDDFAWTLDLTSTTPNYRTFRMEVGADVASVELELVDGTADADLYVRFGATMPNWDTADHRADGSGAEERLVLSRTDVPRLRTGTYYVDVARGGDERTQVSFRAHFTRGWTGQELSGSAPEPSDEEDVEGEIREDALFTLDMRAHGANYRTYVIHVRKGHRSLLVSIRGATTDMDLYLRHGSPIENWGEDSDHKANGGRADETLYVDASSSPPLRAGRYYLDIHKVDDDVDSGPMEVSVRYDAARPEPAPATEGPVRDLAFGERVRVDLQAEGRKAGRFRFQVPAGAHSLHVSVLKATRDVDLFLRHDGPITDYDDASGYDYSAVSVRLNERLDVDEDSEPPLRPGTWYLDAASLLASDRYVVFELVVTVDEPVQLQDGDFQIPPYPRETPLTPLEAAIQATVQIACEAGEGSGTCLSPGGLILTNHHVLALDDGGLQRDQIYVSFPRALDQPPEQIFEAVVVEDDADLDLVLLQVVKDVYGRPLPDTMHLPWLPFGDPAALHHGDTLLVAGYPAVGSTEHRSSLTVTRGVVSGFVARTDGVRMWVKTDARINAGNSGGTALGPNLDFIGVPSMERVDEDDELGYCRPVTLVPASWRDRVLEAQRRDGR